ncbi:MAG TPA: regulatory protein RecX [Vicinamibacterales bacterium]|jgi:regulatory protein
MPSSAYLDALHLLSRRALTVSECRSRLADRNHSSQQIDAAIDHLLETGGLDDARLAREFARTAAEVKGRGRLRAMRDLQARGVEKQVAAEAIGDVFGDKDERALVSRAIQKKLRGRSRPANAAEFARLYQHLMRQGFTPAVVAAVLRPMRAGARAQDIEMDEVE